MSCIYKKKLNDSGYCSVANFYCTFEQEANCKRKKQTNFDRIKAMSVDELAEFIANDRKRIIEPVVEMFEIFRLDKICDIAKENIKEWLESEVQEDEP